MSNPEIDDDVHDDRHDGVVPAGSRRKKRFGSGCLPVLLVLAIVGGLIYFGITKGIDLIEDQFADPKDYPGPGRGSVTIEVQSGDGAAEIGRTLKDADVVASVEAFTDAAKDDASAKSIQSGFYILKLKMAAADAVRLLASGTSRADGTFTILPGKPVSEMVGLLAKATDIKKGEFQKVLDDPSALGLPEGAEGNAEGYLFPGQYALLPNATAVSVLKPMVDAWRAHTESIDFAAAADKLGYTEHEMMTIASMIQAEGSTLAMGDKRKIARVIYNRLEIDPNPAAGFLQIDATVNFALGRAPIARLTIAQIDSVSDSPYNTYRQKGLPPGPIEAPGESAIEAALTPAEGPWFFYVTTNLRTRETKFTPSFAKFQEFKRELDEYCDTQSKRC